MKGHVLRRLAASAPAILSLYAEGASFEQLGEQFGCSRATVRRFLIASDIPLRLAYGKLKLDPHEAQIREAYALGVSVAVLAQRHGVQVETVRRFLFAKLFEDAERRAAIARLITIKPTIEQLAQESDL